MECYKNFAHIYDELINQDIDYKKWCDKIIDICNKHNIEMEEYLDLACGTGNITKELGAFFKHVWAVDLSEDMLTEAEEKLRKEGLKARFICQDLSNLQLNRKFDLITCSLDSTNYLLDDCDIEDYFKGVHNLLKDQGAFIFDMNSYYKLTQVLGNNTFSYDNEEIFYTWENVLEDDIVNMYLTFFIRHGQGYERFDENHAERAYKQEYIEKLLQKTGFNLICKLDNYDNEKINENTERIVYCVRRK